MQCPDKRRTGYTDIEGKLPSSIIEWLDNPARVSEVLLSLIHPFLSKNFTIQAILTSMCDYRTAKKSGRCITSGALIILNLSHCPYASIIDDLLDATNCEVIHSGPEVVLKVLVLSNLEFRLSPAPMEQFDTIDSTSIPDLSTIPSLEINDTLVEIPSCAVCLHRIEPSRLGLPRPRSRQLCSKFCPCVSSVGDALCPRQRLLQPWPLPNYCEACHVICNYWRRFDTFPSVVHVLGGGSNDGNVRCSDCGMRETLWVCLTCGFIGCGRYSNKHASEHNSKTFHPFCLELSTLRIWSYVDSEYVHRLDLLECPSSLQNRPLEPSIGHSSVASAGMESIRTAPLNRLECVDDSDVFSHHAVLESLSSPNDTATFVHHSAENYDRIIATSFASVGEKTPKKATMIGEEYEVLLQSALEEQAQFFEGEISWLRATLTAQHVDKNSVSVDEALEIKNLGDQISGLRVSIDRAGRELLDIQSLEAGHRATSQRLLREQSVFQELLKKIRVETIIEHSRGQEQMDDLELQIADLNTNQKMMEKFSRDINLKNSQIFAAEQHVSPTSKTTNCKKGKKFRKFFQK